MQLITGRVVGPDIWMPRPFSKLVKSHVKIIRSDKSGLVVTARNVHVSDPEAGITHGPLSTAIDARCDVEGGPEGAVGVSPLHAAVVSNTSSNSD